MFPLWLLVKVWDAAMCRVNMVYVFIVVVPSFSLLLLFVEVDAVLFAFAVPSFLLLLFFVEVDAVLSPPFLLAILLC